MIDKFEGDYYFLSNFYPCKVSYNGNKYSSSEAAFQAQKTLDLDLRKRFETYTAIVAKRHGNAIELRPDWEEVKDNIMYEVVKAKFLYNEGLAEQLLDTAAQQLVEGNDWGDTYWGVYKGEGLNKLGRILERVRDELHGPVMMAV